MPACVEPVTVQTMIVSKKTPSSRLLLRRPRGPSSRSRDRRAGAPTRRPGCAYGVPPLASHLLQRVLPGVPDPDVEAARVEPHVGAHDPRQQDVADLVVDGVRPVDPAAPARARHLQAEPRGDRGDLAGVVGLVRRRSRPACRTAADRVRRRGTPACGSCCRRRRGPSCSPRASPRSAGRRGARSAAPCGAPGWGRRAAGSGRSRREPSVSVLKGLPAGDARSLPHRGAPVGCTRCVVTGERPASWASTERWAVTRSPPVCEPEVMAGTPVTRYARSGEVNIAYQVVGDGAGRPGLRARLGLARRAGLGAAGPRGRLPAAGVLLPADPLRQAWHRHVRPGRDGPAAHPGAADGRPARSPRRRRLRARRRLRRLRGREHEHAVRRDPPGPDDRAVHLRQHRAPAPELRTTRGRRPGSSASRPSTTSSGTGPPGWAGRTWRPASTPPGSTSCPATTAGAPARELRSP